MTTFSRAMVLALASLASSSAAAAAQRSDAAVSGVVLGPGGRPQSAVVLLRNLATGQERRVQAKETGRFVFAEVPTGGPYQLVAKSLGGAEDSTASFQLRLGDHRFERIVVRTPGAVRIEELSVRAVAPPDAGPSYAIPGEVVRNLPLFNRDFVGLFATVPQVVGRTLNSAGGQPPSLNAISIDGVSGADAYGVGRTPGSNAGAKSISLEAVDELRIETAPFDVGHSGFTGAMIRAVTRSATNQWAMRGFTAMQHPSLVGADTSGRTAEDFSFLQYGLTVEGPIRKNRLHLFAAFDRQRNNRPYVGPTTDDPATRVSDSTARYAASVFRSRYGFDAGGPEPPTLSQPDFNLFAKLTWRPDQRHTVELSNNFVEARADVFDRTTRNFNNRAGWQLSNSGSANKAVVNTSTLRLTSAWGRVANELVLSHRSIDEDRASTLRVPQFLVGSQVTAFLSGGSVRAAQGTVLDQRTWELSERLTVNRGSHLVSLGAAAELHRFVDNFLPSGWGVWTFPSVDALERGIPNRYEVGLPLRPGGPVADFRAGAVAGYLQDRWSPSDRLTVTAGLRIDVPLASSPTTNTMLAQSAPLGRLDTGDFPSGNAILTPRVSASYVVGERRATTVRAGLGRFVGRPPFAWFGGAFSGTGQEQLTLVCTGPAAPPPTTDIAALPNRCIGGGSAATPPATVTAFDQRFRFPSNQKLVFGVDHDFGSGFRISTDFAATWLRNGLYQVDANLVERGTDSDGRVQYGTFVPATGATSPTRRDTAFSAVYLNQNRTRDRSAAFGVSISKEWGRRGYVALGYQWLRAQDTYSPNGTTVAVAFANAPIDGSIPDRRLRRSQFDVPHNFTLTAIVPLPRGFLAAFLLRAQSGRPYSYVINGDANADGVSGNDLMYVPRDGLDIVLDRPETYGALDQLINAEPCLREQRGRIMARNSCRNPGFLSLDARLAKSVRVLRRPLEIGIDAFNLPNLLNRDWGLIRETSAREGRPVLGIARFDAPSQRLVYRVPVLADGTLPLGLRGVVLDASRWRLQAWARFRL